MKDPKTVLNILSYSIGKKRKTFGHGFEAAYHTVVLDDEEYKGQRDIDKRLENIPIDDVLMNKTVVDLGCNAGGMLLELSGWIKRGIGFDYNSKVINGANAIANYNGKKDVEFYTFDLDNEPLEMMDNFYFGEKPDVFFVLAIALWVKKWKQVIAYCADRAPTLIYETNGDKPFRDEQVEYLKTLYSNVTMLAERCDDDNRDSEKIKKARQLYLCTN